MTTLAHTPAALLDLDASAESFRTGEGLRGLLAHFADHPEQWRDSEVAAALMVYVMDKYGALARKYGLEPCDAAVTAFEVMLTRAVLEADDPWAVITHAVRLTMIYQSRADGLLCSTDHARRADLGDFHDAERFSRRDVPLYEHHQGFQVDFDYGSVTCLNTPVPNEEGEPKNALMALDDAVDLFEQLGWPTDVARNGVEYVCGKLMRSRTRPTAFEYLRRDRFAKVLLDLDQRSWLAMLRSLLGEQSHARRCTNAGRGVMLLLVLGWSVDELLTMPDLVATITKGIPQAAGGGHRG